MQFFDRPSGRARIDMGGSSRRQPSAAELVASVRAQRETRERERRRVAAATSIQAALRASRASRRSAEALATLLSASAAATHTAALATAIPPPSPPPQAPSYASRTSHTPPLDTPGGALSQITPAPAPAPARPRSLTATALVLAAAPGAMPGCDTPPLAFRVRDARLVRGALAQRLANEDGDACNGRGNVRAIVKAAVVFVAAAVDGPHELSPACLSRATRMLHEVAPADRPEAARILRKWPLFDLVAQLLPGPATEVTAPGSDTHHTRSGTLRALVDAALEAAGSDDSLWRELRTKLLTVNDAASFLKFADGPPSFAANLLRHLAADEDELGTFDGYKLAALLGNVLHIGKLVWVSRDPGRLWPLVSVTASIVQHMRHSSLDPMGDSDDGEDDDTDEGRDEKVHLAEGADIVSDIVPVSSGATATPIPTTGNTPMVDVSIIKRLFEALATVVTDENVRSLFIAAVKDGRSATVRVCKLFNVLTRRKPSLQMTFQSALAFWRPADELAAVRYGFCSSSHILPHLWALCRTQDGTGVSLEGDGDEVLLVFVRTYSHFLYVQDEDEMFESQRPFSTDEIRDITLTLKMLLFGVLWSRTSGKAPNSFGNQIYSTASFPNSSHLIDEVSGLMSRLYVCDSRHRFRTSDKFWIAGGGLLTSDVFIKDAVAAGVDWAVSSSGAMDFRRTRSSLYSYSGAMSRRATLNRPRVSGAGDLLRMAPYMVPFQSRAKIFQTWVAAEREKYGSTVAVGLNARTIIVRRNFLFEDAFDELNFLGDDLKKVVRVKFIDEHGIEEAGIDGGGVYKEFMYELLRRGFSPALYGLFLETPDGHLYPNPDSHIVDDLYIRRFEFVGRMLGKALFDGVLVNVPLASFFLSKLLQKFNYPSDLKSLDPELYKNLMFLRKCKPDMVESFELNFVIANTAFGIMDEVELVRGGRNVPVTSRNRIEYIHRVSNYRMNVRMRAQCDAFVRGFSEIIRPEYIRLFSERELQLLISGSTTRLDVADLRRNTAYSGGYSEDSDVIRWFWQVVSEMSSEDQTRFLQFVTSSPRAPLLGFAYLHPSFCVHCAGDEARLPTASTCLNLLKLPHYKDLETLRAKLRYSIELGSGFSLS